MSTFRFGEIKVEVHRMGPDPLHPHSDFYSVKVSHDDTWMESMLEMPKANRTAGSDFEIASNVVSNLYVIASEPEAWAGQMQSIGRMSQEEIDATISVANNLRPYLNEAIRSTRGKFDLYSEHFEAGVGPYDPSMGIARKLELPEHIGNKEEIAQFFAYLYLVDRSSLHPDEDFKTFVDREGRPAYTPEQAEIRNILMLEAIQAAEAEDLDIYELALWVGAVTGANFDPENEESAPKWIKALSKEWV